MTICVDLTKILTYFDFLDSKSELLLKNCFKIWFFSKVLEGNCFFFNSFHQMEFFEKTHNCKNWRFHGLKRSKKWLSERKTIIKVCFCSNQFHFKIWCVVRLFFETWHVLIFYIRILSTCEKMALSQTPLNFLIQKRTRCTKDD